jgi:hypothetical protein
VKLLNFVGKRTDRFREHYWNTQLARRLIEAHEQPDQRVGRELLGKDVPNRCQV